MFRSLLAINVLRSRPLLWIATISFSVTCGLPAAGAENSPEGMSADNRADASKLNTSGAKADTGKAAPTRGNGDRKSTGYVLKSEGLAASCVFAIAVDLDGKTVKVFRGRDRDGKDNTDDVNAHMQLMKVSVSKTKWNGVEHSYFDLDGGRIQFPSGHQAYYSNHKKPFSLVEIGVGPSAESIANWGGGIMLYSEPDPDDKSKYRVMRCKMCNGAGPEPGAHYGPPGVHLYMGAGSDRSIVGTHSWKPNERATIAFSMQKYATDGKDVAFFGLDGEESRNDGERTADGAGGSGYLAALGSNPPEAGHWPGKKLFFALFEEMLTEKHVQELHKNFVSVMFDVPANRQASGSSDTPASGK